MGFNSAFKGLIFSTDFRKNTQHFMKIRPVVDELFRADGRTDDQTRRS